MENTDKASFFAQYLLQPLELQVYEGQADRNTELLTGRLIDNIRNGYKGEITLLLKPLSAISDEDAKEVAKIYGWEETPEKESYLEFGKSVLPHYKQDIRMYQYLQSKGYALPYRQYSVEQQEKMGWIKLTQ